MQRGHNLADLLSMDFQSPIRPDHEIRPGHLLSHRPLGSDASTDLVGVPAAFLQALGLKAGRTRGTKDFLEVGLGDRFKQQRDDDDGDRTTFFFPCLRLGEPPGADGRMENSLEILSGGIVGKNYSGEFIATQPAFLIHYAFAETTFDIDQCRLAGFNQGAGDFVGIDDRHALGGKKTGGGGLAHANTARQSAQFHFRIMVPSGRGSRGPDNSG